MAVSVGENQIQRIIRDLKDAIAELNREYKENGEPISDDSTNLHKCCLKLEYLLQFDQKEKTSFLGTKRDYWDFFCSCLAKVKGANDGIRFVRTILELKTPLGKGRAFIRYSLVHQRLADTIQQCLMNTKVTSDWYYARSPLLKSHLVSDIVIHLYELNEVQFDLASRGHDLDATWPSFARRSFGMSYSPSHLWKPPSRCSSISSLVSNYAQAPESLTNIEINSSLTAEELETLDELRNELDHSDVKQKEMQEKIQQIELDKEELQKAIMLHEQAIEDTRKLSADTMEENLMLKKTMEELSRQCENLPQGNVEKLAKSLQMLEVEKRETLQAKVTELETCSKHYTVLLQSLTQEIERIKSSEGTTDTDFAELQTKLITAEQKNIELVQRVENIFTGKKQLTATHYDSAQKIHEPIDKFNDVEREKIGIQWLNSMQQLQLVTLTNDLKLKGSVIDELELKLKETTLKLEETSIMLIRKDEELESYLIKCREIKSIHNSDTTELESMEKVIQELKNEKDETQIKCKVLDEQIKTLSSQLMTKEFELAAANNAAKNHQEDRNKLFCENNDLRKKLHDLEEPLADGQSRAEDIVEHQKLEIEKKKLQDIVGGNAERETEVEKTCLSLEAEIDRLKSSEKQLQDQIADAMVPGDGNEKKLLEENKQLNEKLQNALQQFKKAEAKLKESQSGFDELKQGEIKLNVCLLYLQRDLHIKEEVISDLQNEVLKSQQNETSPIALAAEIEVNLQKQLLESIEKYQAKMESLEEEKLTLENNFQQQTWLTENLVAEKNELLNTQPTERDLNEKEMEKINVGIVTTKDRFEVEHNEVSRLEEEVEELKSKLKYVIEEKESIHSNLNLAVCSKEEYRTLVHNLKEQIESINRDHAEKLLLLKEKGDYLKKERGNLAQHVIELEKQLVIFKEESSQQKEHNEKLKSENVETKDLLNRANTEMAEFGIQICTLSAEKNAIEQQCHDICQQQTAFFEEMRLEQNQLNVNVSTLKNENEQLQEELRRSEDLAKTVKELQRKLVKTQHQAESFQETAKEEVAATKFQMSGEVMDYQDKLKTVSEELEAVKKDLNEGQSQIASMDKQLANLQDLSNKLKGQLQEKAQIIVDSELLRNKEQEKLKSLSENFISTQQELEVVKKEQEEYKQHQEENQVEMKRNELKLLAEVDDLNRTREFLEERLIELIKDKDALWQKSDALEFEQKLRTEARWIGDREVNYCLDCHSQFTWLLRRHHCRLCGRIFCYYCSNNFVMTKHCGKRERCCRACYSEHSAVVQRFNDPGSDATNSPDESPSRSVSETQIVSNPDSFTKPDDATFDIITDEELNEIEDNDCSLESTNQSSSNLPESELQDASSLSSACDAPSVESPRMPTEDESNQPMQDAEINLLKSGELTLKIPLTVDAIRQFGNNIRELFIKSSCYSLIPITVEECGLTISWVFSSDPKSISFSVVYQESEETSYQQCKVLIPLTRCNSHKETIQGQMKARNPGQYLLIFDNSFSRFTSKKVFYRLTVEKPVIYDGSDISEP
ncbi:FYVE and coiled-coil domain-containing protein 1 isoform X1 [Leucoraja erinacea]|uniref:FYVE and coiled-coil domain-containing protein 1 isoform X1 n=1 Tax=Leucoraja erinaceus TaxID=7782 RepID=UPI002455B1E5|nr:FYVE and coiled-coil domain-containing protein 1 isoform X1 [Leucoraja erinacea]XP_055514153.1 FYVE and coiled-coil domain-containing protein 1 isoform X1 [Leucoraja erinacea]